MNRRSLLLGPILCACLSLTLPGRALSATWTQIEGYALPLNSEAASHIRHLVANQYAVYGLSIDHKLLRFPLDGSRATQETLPGNVIDLSVDPNGQLWIVTVEDLSSNVFVLTREEQKEDPKRDVSAYEYEYPKWKVSAPLVLLKKTDRNGDSEGVYTIAAGNKYTFVLTDKRLAALDKVTGEWKMQTLDHPFDLIERENPVAMVQGDRWVWYGTDAGEWGGHLIVADFHTGEAAELWDADPVTALVPTDGGDHCVLFTVGLAHLGMTEGGIYKTCGNKPEATFTGKEPLWDLIPTKTGLFALSQGALVPMRDGKPYIDERIAFPRKVDQSVAGLPARLISGVLVLYTGARWEVSTSGLTPYAVPLPSDAKVQLQPYPLVNEYPNECANSEPTPSDDDLAVMGWQKEPAKSRDGTTGVELTLKGWDPTWEAGAYGIDAACHIVPITPMGHVLDISADKSAILFVPYATSGLHSGHWNLYVVVFASGKQATLEFSMNVP